MSKKRVRLSAPQRRDHIVDAAIEVIAQKGFLETSFQMIADRCGVSQSAVLYHFPRKEGLIEAVILRLVEHNNALVASLMKPEDNALTRLIKHFWGNLSWAIRFESEGQTLLLLYYLASFDPHFSGIYTTILTRARARIGEHLHAGIREKLFRSDLDVEAVSESLHDALLGSLINHLTVRRSGRRPKSPRLKWESLLRLYTV